MLDRNNGDHKFTRNQSVWDYYYSREPAQTPALTEIPEVEHNTLES